MHMYDQQKHAYFVNSAYTSIIAKQLMVTRAAFEYFLSEKNDFFVCVLYLVLGFLSTHSICCIFI